MFINAWAIGSIRFGGMMLPAKHAAPPVTLLHEPDNSGSRMKTRRFRLSKVWEKSPRRYSSVGTRRWFSPPGSVRESRSWDQKKNSLFRCLLNPPGNNTGPPSVQAPLSNLYNGLCNPCWRREYSLPLSDVSRL